MQGVIVALEKECKETKAKVEVLSTDLMASQQSAESHQKRAAELELRILAYFLSSQDVYLDQELGVDHVSF